MDETSLLTSTELLFQLKTVELIQSHQHLPRGWCPDTTIVLIYPDDGEFCSFLGKEWCGLDGLECGRELERLSTTEPAPESTVS